jgi:hypothetical protein
MDQDRRMSISAGPGSFGTIGVRFYGGMRVLWMADRDPPSIPIDRFPSTRRPGPPIPMKIPIIMRVLLFLLVAVAALPAGAGAQRTGPEPRSTLPRFRSEAELARFVGEHRQAQGRIWRARTDSVKASLSRCARIEVSAPAEPAARGDSAIAVLSGQVLDTVGRPVRGAVVRTAPPEIRAAAAEDGRYRLEIPAGRLAGSGVTVTVSGPGMWTASASVPLAPGRSARASFRLCSSFAFLTGESPVGEPANLATINRENGMVRVHGEHLVVLRRGRLFTVRIGARAPRPVAMVDAGIDPENADYNQLFVSGDLVIVVGYSGSADGPEVGLFRIDGAGRLSHASTYHLGAMESPSSVTTRLVGGKLVFYAPLLFGRRKGGDLAGTSPTIRRWHPGVEDGEEDDEEDDDGFRPIPFGGRLHRPARPMDPAVVLALHTITVCGVARAELDCAATGTVGPVGLPFHVSPRSVLVWTTGWARSGEGREPAVVYRLPLDGSAPSALGVAGHAVDEASFLESGDGHLNVLVRAERERVRTGRLRGPAALLRVPLARLGDGSADAPASAYTPLPTPDGGEMRGRFVGRHLLYGAGSEWGEPPRVRSTYLHVVEWASGRSSVVRVPHAVDWIDAMGSGAVVVGADEKDLHFSAVRLSGRPAAAGRHVLRGVTEDGLCSTGFFYRADGEDAGIVALPAQGPCTLGHELPDALWRSVVFLRERAGRLEKLGTLETRTDGTADDGCRANCTDEWSGDTRPLFFRGRVFAVLGYELVEGEVRGGRIREVGRTVFGPPEGN